MVAVVVVVGVLLAPSDVAVGRALVVEGVSEDRALRGAIEVPVANGSKKGMDSDECFMVAGSIMDGVMVVVGGGRDSEEISAYNKNRRKDQPSECSLSS